MSPQPNAPPPNAHRAKALAAVLLGLVLLVVLGYRTSEHDNVLATVPAAAPQATTTPAIAAAASEIPVNEAPPLPPVDLTRILRHNPFRGGRTPTAGGLAGDGVQKAGASLVGLRSLIGSTVGRLSTLAGPRLAAGTGASRSAATDGTSSGSPASGSSGSPNVAVLGIVTGGARPAALIGDKMFYENDLLDNGLRIVAIRAHGIVVESAAD